jgi:hypothetical protein
VAQICAHLRTATTNRAAEIRPFARSNQGPRVSYQPSIPKGQPSG